MRKRTLQLFGYLLILSMSSVQAQTVEKLALINAETNQEVSGFTGDGDTIDIEATPLINFRAITSPEPLASGKCVFNMTTPGGAAFSHSEGGAPYACFGDISGDYKDWENGLDGPPSIEEGAYSLKVTPGSGAASTYTFVIIKGGGSTGGGTGSDTINVENGEVLITGEKKQWHNITLNIGGPTSNETATPNPFKDYRLQATFTKGDISMLVPGYFAADGSAGETGAVEGNIWRIHFCPSETGTWNYIVSFRNGRDVALSNELEAGSPVTPLDGMSGSLDISASDKEGRDFRSRGRLSYIGERYLQFAGTGEYFLKVGPDSPENFLAYEGFDNTPNSGGRRKSYSAHLDHWMEGNPTWKSGKGKSIIGSLNYLASKGTNSFSFLTMNINGDDKNVYPYVTSGNRKQFDVSKLDQWGVVFEYAQSIGMFLHFKTQETENEKLLDGGNTSTERKLYYRELIARYGHNLALNWNLGEESGASFMDASRRQSDAQRKAMAAYFNATDPYQNHIVIHTAPGDHSKIYTPLLGNNSKLTGASIQTDWKNVHNDTKTWITKSKDAGKPWVIANDEQGRATWGVPEDGFVSGVDSKGNTAPNKHEIRNKVLWGNLMAGGAGVEYYFGYDWSSSSDLTCQDFTSRNDSWEYCKNAVDFFNLYVPFWDMTGNDGLTTVGYCLANHGSVYIVYLPNGGSTSVALGDGTYSVKWYNPRTGGELQNGSTGISGGGMKAIGAAPDAKDWVALITESTFTHDGNSGAPTEVPGLPEDPVVIPDECGDPIVLTSFTDFAKFTDIPGFKNAYKDNGNQCLAINAAQFKGEFAAAQTTFNGGAGLYNITITTLRELDGESTYRLRVGGTLVGEYKNAETETDYAPSTYTWPSVEVNTNDVIQVEFSSHTNGKIPENGGTAFSRGRWTQLRFGPVCTTCDGPFIEEDGYLVIEAESAADYEKAGFTLETQKVGTTLPLGAGFLRYSAQDNMGAYNPQNTISYKIKINTPGKYRFLWRNVRDPQATSGDAANDSWILVKGDGCRFYGAKGATEYTLDHHTKSWVQKSDFVYENYGETHVNGTKVNSMAFWVDFSKVGEYTIEYGGRSKGHSVDRLVFFMSGKESIAKNTLTPESKREGCSGYVPVEVLAEDVYIAHDTIVKFPNESYAMQARVLPDNTTDRKVSWMSSNTSVASVDENGNISTEAEGSAWIVSASQTAGIKDSCYVIVLEDKNRVKLDKTKWTAIYADSEDTEKGDGVKEKAIDGDLETFWHTQWFSAKPVLPHEIQIDLGSESNIDFIDYWHRQDIWGPNGAIGEYEIYVSNSTSDWGDPVIKDYMRWANDCDKEQYKEMRRVFLQATATGRYLRLVALTEAQNDPAKPLTAIAELDVWQYTVNDGLNTIQEMGIQVFPSPFRSMLTVRSKHIISSAVLYHVDGRKAYEAFENSKILGINTNDLTKGVYILMLKTEKHQTVSHKVIKY